ncbi:unnamed protein product [Phytophthora fragariaefolia]|uniref:Unnamed protein product n=1 Tax=Phytophthora fragariaefolia TaxID=1490495 RepID=A0A9W6XDH5_9STRA|nr:unnamed protein product [Phytophthora fragariaefolia]
MNPSVGWIALRVVSEEALGLESLILDYFDLNSQADVDLGPGLPWVCVFVSSLAASSSGGLRRGSTDARSSALGVWVHFDLGVFDVLTSVG